MAVNQLRLGQSEVEIRRVLGDPASKSESHTDEVVTEPLWSLSYPEVSLEFTGSRVTKISCSGESCVTPDGVRIGDSGEVVERVYGAGRYDSLGQTLTYFAQRSDCSLIFILYSGKVGTIKLSCDQT